MGYSVYTVPNRVGQISMPGATNYVLSDGNDTNDYNTSTPSSSLSSTAGTAVVVVYPWVQHKYST